MIASQTVIRLAVNRYFQYGRVSTTPKIRFIESMTATKRLELSQSKAIVPNKIAPDSAYLEGLSIHRPASSRPRPVGPR